MKKLLTSVLLLTSLSSFAADYTGTLQKDSENNLFLKLSNDGSLLKLDVSESQHKTISSFLIPYPNWDNYTVKLSAIETENGIAPFRAPLLIGGPAKKIGVLHRFGTQMTLGGKRARLGRVKKIYRSAFDLSSIRFFADREVISYGHYDQHGTYVINSLLPAHVVNVGETLKEGVFEGVRTSDPIEFITKKLPSNLYSQSKSHLKIPVLERERVVPGDTALIITLSGRQGDVIGAAGGHFAIGMGEVNEELRLEGELFNFYFKGSKEIMAGRTDLINYFGHIIQGQQNYRPTYTLFIYGINKEKLNQLKVLLETQNERVRGEPGLSITPYYNCTTVSNDALALVGINGNHKELVNEIFDLQNLGLINPISWFAKKIGEKKKDNTLTSLSYLSTQDWEYFVPRNAFMSYLKQLKNMGFIEKHNIKRAEFNFIPQTPSGRARGGISYDQMNEAQTAVKNKDKTLSQNEIDRILLSFD